MRALLLLLLSVAVAVSAASVQQWQHLMQGIVDQVLGKGIPDCPVPSQLVRATYCEHLRDELRGASFHPLHRHHPDPLSLPHSEEAGRQRMQKGELWATGMVLAVVAAVVVAV